MSEGRRSQVVLLDDRRLDILIRPRLYAGELLDMVASHFQLKEKEYFGLAFINDANQLSYLQLEKRVLEQELPKKVLSQDSTLVLHFRVKYFVESIEHLRDAATVEAYYLQSKLLLSKGEIEVDSDTVLKLAALVLQATYGDYEDDITSKTHLRRLPILPSSVLQEYSSITLCEEKVLQHYKDQIGQSRGNAILNYLKIIENLPTYGQHYYEIKDGKTGLPCWLGLSYKGISQYEKNNRCHPQRVFLWKQLENLYHRDKKFTIEVHEARRVVHTLSSFNLYEDAIEEPVEDYDDLSDAICDPTTQVSVSRRTLAPANVTVYVWYASSPLTTKCIWAMAISQHLFFLNQKKNRSKSLSNLNQIASDLCRSAQSLSSAGSVCNISRSNSTGSLPSTILGGEIHEEKQATLEMLEALRTRKDALEAVLTKKNEELKVLCLQEGELTGEIPPEIPLKPGEVQPQVRRRIGTSFSLSDKLISKTKNNDRETLCDLELQYEIQSKIASAAFQLMHNCNSRKSVRKQRKLSYNQATLKLRDIEDQLCTLKKEKKKEELECQNADTSEDSLGGASVKPSQASAESNLLKNTTLQTSSVVPSASLPELTVTECQSPSELQHDMRQYHHATSMQQLPFSIPSTSVKQQDSSVLFKACRNSQSSSQRLEYDSISCGSANSLPLRVSYRNRYEPRLDIDGTNLYSVPNRRASQVFDSQDDMLFSEKKCDIECQPTTTKGHDIKPIYSNTLPLSVSYDDRMWYGETKDNTLVSSDGSSLETSFEAHSNNSCETASLSCFSSESYKQSSCNSPKNLPKQSHFHSENALNRDVSSPVIFPLDNVNNSSLNFTQPIQQKKITHVLSVPHLCAEPATKLEPQRINFNCNTNQHNINQAMDLVQASILLQNGKKTINSAKYSAPRPKTKEWIETSLDSPILPRKQRSKDQSQPAKIFFEEEMSPTPFSSNVSRFSPLQMNVASSEPEYRHCEQIETDNQSSSYHIPPPAIDSNCNSTYYKTQILNTPSAGNTVSVQNCDYPFPESDNVSFRSFQRNSRNAGFSSMSDISSLYSEYCDPVLCFDKPTDSYCSPSHSFHPTLQSNVTSQPLQPFPTVQSCHTMSSTSDNISISDSYNGPHYANVSSISTHPTIPTNPSVDSAAVGEHFYAPSRNSFPNSPVTSTHQYKDEEMYALYPTDHEAALSTTTIQETHPTPQCSLANVGFPSNVQVNVVSIGQFQPYWEETKPYELSDFYKYSTKHRKSIPKQNDCSKSSSSSTIQLNPDGNWINSSSTNLPISSAEILEKCSPNVKYISEQDHELLLHNQSSIPVPANYSSSESDCVPESFIKQSATQKTLPSTNISDSNQASLGDTFHDEMLAWYEKHETVKKATLV